MVVYIASLQRGNEKCRTTPDIVSKVSYRPVLSRDLQKREVTEVRRRPHVLIAYPELHGASYVGFEFPTYS
jgi:hypothetical protein